LRYQDIVWVLADEVGGVAALSAAFNIEINKWM
jgi:hypothetical protein